MGDLRILTQRQGQVVADIAQALRFAGYGPSQEKEGTALCQRLLPILRRSLQPKAALSFTDDKLYVVLTLGKGVSWQLSRYEEDGQYNEALLFNALADTCLFQLEKKVLAQVQQICQQKKIGIACRQEPGSGLPLSWQKKAVEETKAARTLGVTVNEAFALSPVKSMSLIFTLTADTSVFLAAHDCRTCANVDCPGRQTEKSAAEKEVQLRCPPAQNIAAYIQKQHLSLALPCGGQGVCGKCRIRLLKGSLPVTEADRKVFTPAQLQAGWRLACQAVSGKEAVEIAIPAGEKEFAALSLAAAAKQEKEIYRNHQYGFAIDIGTTTIAIALADITTKKLVTAKTAVNNQRAFGADVISRIQAANEGKEALMQQAVRQDICQLLQQFFSLYPELPALVTKMTVAANTTMLHLLMGWSCQGLGDWPFSPVSLGGKTYPLADVLGDDLDVEDCPVTLLPGMSTYVGADITAGIAECELTAHDEWRLLLDLGTNGEMALGHKGKLLIASAPAGPALEGGKLSWGMGSVPGAICSVSFVQGRPQVKTIADQPPLGLCGTGIIEAMAALVQEGVVDGTGKLKEPYFKTGFPLALTAQGKTIMLNQTDIREIQMAKSAIRAGMESLLKAAGISYAAIGHVYLAGGFGYYLKPKAAAQIGLLPAELVEKTSAAGNTSLQGALSLLLQETDVQALQRVAESAEEIVLGNDPQFQQLYLAYLNF